MSQWGLDLEIHKVFSKFGKCETNLTPYLYEWCYIDGLPTMKC